MTTAIASPPLKRFLWKEYRMLRGLWLAVLALGLLVDWLLSVLLAPPADFPMVRLCVALAAATLYAAGAAAVLFSVEHEERTYDFLRGLPATWQPLFTSKLLVATVSAVALAAVLAILGMHPGGHFRPPSADSVRDAGSVLGLAIVEAVAWGTLCSLVFKRPLAAALTTIIVGPLVVSWAVSVMSSSSVPLNDAASFAAAIPLRLAIVVALFALSTIMARRWLVTKTAATSTGTVSSSSILSALQNRIESMQARAARRIDRSHGRAMIVRLVWQSWRESWKFLAAPVVLAAICLVIGLFGGHLYDVTQRHPVLFPFLSFCLFCCLLASPVLLGALAFSADQRRGSVCFLAEHAATPRVVWLGRHIVWSGTMLVLLTLIVIAAATLMTNVVQSHLQEYQRYHDEFDSVTYSWDARQLRDAISSGLYAGTTAMTFLWFGALAAYAIGQFCSMLLRSEILSAFTSLILAVVLIAWIAALIAWGLSSWLFLLPLVIAFMAATWLRAPYWIASRNSWRTWAWPAALIVGALAFLGVMLPQVRLNQVRGVPSPLRATNATRPTATESVLFVKQHDKEAAATAEMYLRAASLLTTSITDIPLELWEKPEFFSYGNVGVLGSIDVSRLFFADQVHEFLTTKQKHTDLYFRLREDALKHAIEASQRPTCQFEFPLSPPHDASRYNYSLLQRLEPNQTYKAVSALLHELISTPIVDPPFDQLLAALRMNRHMMMNQPTAIVVRQLQSERQILAEIAKTMAADERTNAERRAAIEKLQAFYQRNPVLDQTLVAELHAMRDVINGKEPPLILASKPIGNDSYVAFMANELPWERERAFLALDLITDQNRQNAQRLMISLSRSAGQAAGINELRQWFRPSYRPALWLTQQPAAVTSYLVSMEYQLRVPVNELFLEYCHTVTVERANLLQIALAMYRADYKEYPPTLEILVPKYLEKLPLDPFSMQPFQYRSTGYEKQLKCSGTAEANAIAPNTPLLWSIGPNNLHIREGYNTQAANDTAETESPGPEGAPTRDLAGYTSDSTFYVLEPADWDQRYTFTSSRDFVFTLPK